MQPGGRSATVPPGLLPALAVLRQGLACVLYCTVTPAGKPASAAVMAPLRVLPRPSFNAGSTSTRSTSVTARLPLLLMTITVSTATPPDSSCVTGVPARSKRLATPSPLDCTSRHCGVAISAFRLASPLILPAALVQAGAWGEQESLIWPLALVTFTTIWQLAALAASSPPARRTPVCPVASGAPFWSVSVPPQELVTTASATRQLVGSVSVKPMPACAGLSRTLLIVKVSCVVLPSSITCAASFLSSFGVAATVRHGALL